MKRTLSLFVLLAAACNERPPAHSAGTNAEPTIVPPEGTALETACVTTGPELCFDGVDNNCNGLFDEGCGMQSGVVQIVAAWKEAEADVDLLVTDPAGETARFGSATSTGLTKDKDCPGSDRRCRGQNVENVFVDPEAEPRRGTYKVEVRLEKLANAKAPIVVRIGARTGNKSAGFVVSLAKDGDSRTFSVVY